MFMLPVVTEVEADNYVDADIVCAICLDALQDGDERMVTLPCNHKYHPSCIGEWQKRSESCPLCRMDTSVSVRQEVVNELTSLKFRNDRRFLLVTTCFQIISSIVQFAERQCNFPLLLVSFSGLYGIYSLQPTCIASYIAGTVVMDMYKLIYVWVITRGGLLRQFIYLLDIFIDFIIVAKSLRMLMTIHCFRDNINALTIHTTGH